MQSILGQKFGHLTVIEEVVDITKKNRQIVRCQCDCGNIHEALRCNILCGRTKSCGCMRRGRPNDLIGKRFGKLVVIDRFAKLVASKNEYHAVCKCDCGEEKTVLVRNLIGGRTTSCGCRKDQYEKITGKNSKRFTGYEEIPGYLIARIKAGAESRKLEFSVDLEHLWKMFLAQDRKCALSGKDICFGKYRSGAVTASLDRIDNSKGYVVGNVQWVHKDLNIMRNRFDIEYFIEICRQVVARYDVIRNSTP